MTRLDGSVAIITGAARGQGEAQARLFVERGAKVVVADILDAEGEQVAKSLGDDATFQHLDVSEPEGWQVCVARASEHFGKIDVLINNAAIIDHAPLESMELERYMRLVNVNQVGCFLGMQAVVPFMREAGGGSIVNTSSIMGLTGLRSLGAYTATKFAVRGMTKVAAMEWGRYGIRVNSVHPGFVDTEMAKTGAAGDDAEHEILVPLRRMARPEEIAELMVFLASPASSYCTGSEFVADGGWLAGVEPAIRRKNPMEGTSG
jgi:3alpha(or 20beta)-hydroxysteroid dehydrogenase